MKTTPLALARAVGSQAATAFPIALQQHLRGFGREETERDPAVGEHFRRADPGSPSLAAAVNAALGAMEPS